MNAEMLINGKPYIVPNKQKIRIGFTEIPKDLLKKKDTENCIKFMQNQLSFKAHFGDNTNTHIEKFQKYCKDNGHPEYIKVLSGSEQEKKHEIHQKCVAKFTESILERYNYHFDPSEDSVNDHGTRFFYSDIMQHTDNTDNDKKYNNRISELIERAQKGEFADDKVDLKDTKSELTKDREELLDHIRKYVDISKKFDFKKAAEEGISDEKIAENPIAYYDLGLITGQYDNVCNELRNWGITDEETSKTIEQNNKYAGFYGAIKNRLSYILDFTYDIFDEKSLPDEKFQAEHELQEVFADNSSTEMVISSTTNVSDFKQFSLVADEQTIQCLFEELGFQKNDIVCNSPELKNNKETVHLNHVMKSGEPFKIHSKSQPDLEMTFGNFPDMTLTRMMLSEKNLDFQKTVQKPKELSRWDKFTDFFSGIFTRHKPKAEKYEKDVKSYNSLAAIFDPKSVIPTNPPTKNPVHDLFGIRHSLRQENKTKDDYTKIMNRLNELATNDGRKATLQNSVKTLTEKFSRQVEAYNEAHPNPEDQVVLTGSVAQIVNTLRQNAPQNVRQVQQPVQQNIIEGNHPEIKEQPKIQNKPLPEFKKEEPKPEIIEDVKQEPKSQPQPEIIEQPKIQNKPLPEFKKEEPKPEIIEEIKPVAQKSPAEESLEEEQLLTERYSGKDGVKQVYSVLSGSIFHDELPEESKLIIPGTAMIPALFGQDPKNFPGEDGLSPMEKKMRFLERALTERGFTESKEYKNFESKCYQDYSKIKHDLLYSKKEDSQAIKKDIDNAKAGNETIEKGISYLNESARTLQHLAVRSPRLSVTTTMLGACAKNIQKELADFKAESSKIKYEISESNNSASNLEISGTKLDEIRTPLYTDEDAKKMENVNAICDGVQLLGNVYANGVKSELALVQKESLPPREKEQHLLNLMTVERFNQSVIAPSHEEAGQAVKKNQHSNADLGIKTMRDTLNGIQKDLSLSPAFKKLTQADDLLLSDTILYQPEKILSAAEEISKEIANPPKKEIRQEEPRKVEVKPVAAEPTTVESLEKDSAIADLYTGIYGYLQFAAVLKGNGSLHEAAFKNPPEKSISESAVALFGQAPEKFPGEAGLSPAEKKMQYLERVLTEEGFTRSDDHKKFMEQCSKDYTALRNAKFDKSEAGIKAAKDCIDYLSESMKSVQQLAVRSPRMSVTTTMLGACAQCINVQRSSISFWSSKEHASVLDVQDKQAMNDISICCQGIHRLGDIYAEGIKSELVFAKKEPLPSEKKKSNLLNIMLAENINQSVITPDHAQAVQAVSQGQRPTAQKLTEMSSPKLDQTIRDLRKKTSEANVFKTLEKVTDSILSDAILNKPQMITDAAAEISKRIAEQPKKVEIKQEPKPVAAKPTDVKLLERKQEIADLYAGDNAKAYISSMLDGNVSLHEPAAGDNLPKDDSVSIVALFGQAPEKFPGQEGLTPTEKKMQYLENVMTKKDFTKDQKHKDFLTKCCTDYTAVRESAYLNTKKNSKTIQKFVSYLNESAKSLQNLAVRSSRMTSITPMLGVCAQVVQQNLSKGMTSFRDKDEQPLFSARDRYAMSNVNARCSSIQLLGKAYADGIRSELALVKKNQLTDEEKKQHLLNLMTAEKINHSVIAPTHKEAAQSVRENKHPDAETLTSLGGKKVDDKMSDIYTGISKTSTFEALTKVKESDISTAILNQPMKIAAVEKDISAEISTGNPVHKNAGKYVNHLFDPKNILDQSNPFLA